MARTPQAGRNVVIGHHSLDDPLVGKSQRNLMVDLLFLRVHFRLRGVGRNRTDMDRAAKPIT